MGVQDTKRWTDQKFTRQFQLSRPSWQFPTVYPYIPTVHRSLSTVYRSLSAEWMWLNSRFADHIPQDVVSITPTTYKI